MIGRHEEHRFGERLAVGACLPHSPCITNTTCPQKKFANHPTRVRFGSIHRTGKGEPELSRILASASLLDYAVCHRRSPRPPAASPATTTRACIPRFLKP